MNEDLIAQAIAAFKKDRTKENLIAVLIILEKSNIWVAPFLKQGDTFITCVFGEIVDGRVIQKGTQAKIARGEIVRYMAEHGISEPEGIKGFDRPGYRFHPELSSDGNDVFLYGMSGE